MHAGAAPYGCEEQRPCGRLRAEMRATGSRRTRTTDRWAGGGRPPRRIPAPPQPAGRGASSKVVARAEPTKPPVGGDTKLSWHPNVPKKRRAAGSSPSDTS